MGVKAQTKLIKEAYRKGKQITEFVAGSEFRKFLARKVHYTRKRIRVYRGYVFIFNINSDKCITMYAIPDRYMKEYEESERGESHGKEER